MYLIQFIIYAHTVFDPCFHIINKTQSKLNQSQFSVKLNYQIFLFLFLTFNFLFIRFQEYILIDWFDFLFLKIKRIRLMLWWQKLFINSDILLIAFLLQFFFKILKMRYKNIQNSMASLNHIWNSCRTDIFFLFLIIYMFILCNEYADFSDNILTDIKALIVVEF